MPYQDSYIAKVREKVGHDFLLVMPTIDVVIKNSADEFLLIYNRDFDAWAFPGGYNEPELSWQENAAREALEEGGVQINPAKLQLIGNVAGKNYVAKYANGDTTQLFTNVYLCEEWEAESDTIDTTEIDAKKWVPASELATTKLSFAAKAVWEVYQQYRATGQAYSLNFETK